MTDRKIIQQLFLFQNAEEACKNLALPEPITYERGEVIYGSEKFERALGILLCGKAEAVTRERSALTTFRAGDTFGAAVLFGGEQSISTVRATTMCRVQYISEDTLRQLFRDYPQTAMNYIGFLSEKIRFLNGKIATYTSSSVAGRLYYWLSNNGDEAGHLPPGMTMTKLAKILNVGRTSLYRAREELAREGLIDREKGEGV